jgi:hypothetical protein
VQNGPGGLFPPHFDQRGILHLSRAWELEPAIDPAFSVEASLRWAAKCFERKIPAIVSVHSINFHSTVCDYRSRTLRSLDEFLTSLESKHVDLLYVHDEDLQELVSQGSYQGPRGRMQVNVTKRSFIKAQIARWGRA